MPVADELLQISKMHIDIESKNWLRENLLTQVGILQHIKAIDGCVAHEQETSNIAGLLDLLELKLEVMLECPAPSPFSDEECMQIADQIHTLAMEQFNALNQAKQEQRSAQLQPASAAVLVEERPRFKAGRRASRSRRTW